MLNTSTAECIRKPDVTPRTAPSGRNRHPASAPVAFSLPSRVIYVTRFGLAVVGYAEGRHHG